MALGERRLFCEVIRDAVHSAMRGDSRARYWIVEELDSTFLTLCHFLGLDVAALRSAVTLVGPAKQPNQYSRKELVPESANAALERPWKPLPPVSPSPGLANALAPVSGPLASDPVGIASGWTTDLNPLQWGIPLPKKRRRNAK
jgi:hypothetical protein